MAPFFKNEKIAQLDQNMATVLWDALRQAFRTDDPIRVAMIGESGVGKTSTINALFNTNLPVSHFGSCTQNAELVKTMTPKGVPLEIIDMPGLWAGEQETRKHWKTYRDVLPTADCVIWVISAGDRALEGMQKALKTMSSFLRPEIIDNIVFAINKAEHMHPEDWNSSVNLPSYEQQINLEKFCRTVKTAIQEKFPYWNGTIVYYSARKQFRLDELLEQMIISASPEKRLSVARAAEPKSYEEQIGDRRALEVAQKMLRNREKGN